MDSRGYPDPAATAALAERRRVRLAPRDAAEAEIVRRERNHALQMALTPEHGPLKALAYLVEQGWLEGNARSYLSCAVGLAQALRRDA